MPNVTCPSCGERGKISPKFIGARIKCKKCGNSFNVAAPTSKEVSAAVSPFSPTAPRGHGGIEVEGLDASSWSISTETGVTLQAEALPEEGNADQVASIEADASCAPAESRQYKLLTSKDKYFEGKFELGRLEEALNHFAREGWSVKAMTLPHIKGYTGVTEEMIVVLLER